MVRADERGFSLLETLIAVSLVAIALFSLVQLLAIAVQANATARRSSMASVLALQKTEELRRAPDLIPQPPTSLDANTPGLCDFLDAYGQSLGSSELAPAGTTYVRRWSITALPADPTGSMLLQVVVIPTSTRRFAKPDGADPRRFGGAQVVTIETRRSG